MNPNRRQMILGGGAAIALPTIIGASSAAAYTNEPSGSTVTLGFNVPQSGPYADEGNQELLAYQLAVEHLNGAGDGGMLNTFSSKVLQGNGILGKKVNFVTGDTQTNSIAARDAAKSMIEKDGAVMVSGGSTSHVATAVQGLCQEAGVIFMAGVATGKSLTGHDQVGNGFRHFVNTNLAAGAVASAASESFGFGRRAFHLTDDYSWGWEVESAMTRALEKRGWETADAVKIPLVSQDYSSILSPFLNSGADVLVLNQYGGSLVNSLTTTFQLGLREKQVDGKNIEIVVPLISQLMASMAAEKTEGVMGATNWHWKMQNDGTRAFNKSFGEKYGYPPSEAAHTCYCQTILYADAVARAGTFNPCGVVEALEGFEFYGLGNGLALYSAGNHQCYKSIPIVKGKRAPDSYFDLLDIVGEEDPCDDDSECPDDVGRSICSSGY